MRFILAAIAIATLVGQPAYAQGAASTTTTNAEKTPKTSGAAAKRKALVGRPSAGATRMETLSRKSDRIGREMENSVCKC